MSGTSLKKYKCIFSLVEIGEANKKIHSLVGSNIFNATNIKYFLVTVFSL